MGAFEFGIRDKRAFPLPKSHPKIIKKRTQETVGLLLLAIRLMQTVS